MSTYRVKFTFGKYPGLSLGEVAERNPSYLNWISGSASFPMPWRIAAAKTMLGESVDGLNLPTNYIPPAPIDKPTMFAVDVEKGTIGVRFSGSKAKIDAFKEAVDTRKWNADEGRWEFNRVHIIKAVNFFGGTKEIYPDEHVKQWYQDEAARIEALNHIRAKKDSDIQVPTLLPLYPFQKVDVEFGHKAGNRWMDADEQGLGKSPTALGWALTVGGKTLICVPANVYFQWPDAVKKFTGEGVCLWGGTGHKGKLSAQFHLVSHDEVKKFVAEFNKMKFSNLIVDEATAFKNYKSVRTKALFGSYKERKQYPGVKTPNVLLLTGTPILNRPMELFTLLSFLDKKRFNNPFVFMERYGGTAGLQTKNLNELHHRINELVIRHLRADVAKEIPPKQRQELPIEMTEAQRKAYNKELGALFKQWKLVGRPSAAHMPTIRTLLFDIKFKYIIDFVDNILDQDKPVIVFTVHQEHAERIAKHYGATARLIHGGVDKKLRQGIKQDIIDGKAKVLVMTIIAGGMGLDGLQEVVTDIVFADRWWVPAIHHQAEDRIVRFGQKHPTMMYYLTVRGTYDEYMADVLSGKQSIIDQALEGKIPEDATVEAARTGSIFGAVYNQMCRDYDILDTLDEVDEELELV